MARLSPLLVALILLTAACRGQITPYPNNGPPGAPPLMNDGTDLEPVGDSHNESEPPVAPLPSPVEALVFGTLNPKAVRAQQIASSVFSTVEFVVAWDRYEPQQGDYSPSYLFSLKTQLAQFVAAGIRPTLSFSHHYTPSWVCSLPGAAFVDQNGLSKCGKPHNMVFSQPVRDAMNRTIAHIAENLGVSHFSAVRVMTAGVSGEISYPSGGTYWAYDANASGGNDRPATIPVRPLGTWKPGQTGRTQAEVRAWLEWYLAALADAVDFQIETYLKLGFQGPFHPIQPGVGVKPGDVNAAVVCNLGCGSKYLGQGVAWFDLYAHYKHKEVMTVYTSSLGQRPTAQDCLSGDSALSPTSAEVSAFDVGRYAAYIAHWYGVRPAGENPGPLDTNYGADMMKAAIRVARSCDYSHMYWAHEDQLFETSRPGISLQAFELAAQL